MSMQSSPKLPTEKLLLKSGPSGTPLELDVAPMNIIVGPNNSGKSTLLREINNYISMRGGQTYSVLEGLTFANISPISFIDNLTSSGLLEKKADSTGRPIAITRRRMYKENRGVLRIDEYDRPQSSTTPSPQETKARQYALKQICSHFIVELNGKTRLDILKADTIGNVHQPVGVVPCLFTYENIRARWQQAVYKATNSHIVLDPTRKVGTAHVAIAPRSPEDRAEELEPSYNKCRDFHKKSIPIDQMGDGLQCFAGILAVAMVGGLKILLVDEPEAFLHPPLARKLGRHLATLAQEHGMVCFVATHSADFLIGAAESNIPTNVVRLNYDGTQGSAKLLPAEQIRKLINNPLLRSSHILSGLFHRGVVVCEADSDRAFYEEVNNRLLDSGKGIRDCMFVNGNGKSTLPTLVKALREVGVPTAVIYDLDILAQKSDFGHIISATGMSIIASSLKDDRSKLIRLLDKHYPDKAGLKKISLDEFEGDTRTLLFDLLSRLNKCGIFPALKVIY